MDFVSLTTSLCRAERLWARVFSVFRFTLLVPTPKFKCHRCAGGAQFIRQWAVDHSARNDHAPNGQGRYGLRGRAALTAFLDQAALQDAHHCLKDGLESAPGAYLRLRDTSVGSATIGQEFSTSSKCWRDR